MYVCTLFFRCTLSDQLTMSAMRGEGSDMENVSDAASLLPLISTTGTCSRFGSQPLLPCLEGNSDRPLSLCHPNCYQRRQAHGLNRHRENFYLAHSASSHVNARVLHASVVAAAAAAEYKWPYNDDEACSWITKRGINHKPFSFPFHGDSN